MAKMRQALCNALRKKANAIEINDGAAAASMLGRAKVATGPTTPAKAAHAAGGNGLVASPPSAKATDAAQGAVPAGEPAGS
eukprot:751680-Alexandrium_andersonii.AAC.1